MIPVTVPGRRGDEVITDAKHPAPAPPSSHWQAETRSGQTGPGSHRDGGQLQRAERRGRDVPGHHSRAGGRTGPDTAGAAGVVGSAGGPRGDGHRAGATTEVALRKAGLALDIDVVELNEAFAAQALAVMREWRFTDADRERTNVHGSGISLGHPVGATGGRMLATLARELHRRDALRRLETMCIGGGRGLAAVFERVGTL